MYKDGYKDIPNLFCPAAFDRPIKVNYVALKDNEKYWDQLPRLHTLVIYRDVREQELLHILLSLKPSAIKMLEEIFEDEDSAIIKEGLQPYLVKKLDVNADKYLERTLNIVTLSDELLVWTDSILSKEQIRVIESLGLKRLEVKSMDITRKLLKQVNAIKVQKKCVTGISENKEVWSEEVIASYGHLFRKGDEPQLYNTLHEGNQASLLKRAIDNMSKAP
jgi:hypothetical protein